MVSSAMDQGAVLDKLEPRWRKHGYTLVRRPAVEQLPDFLKGYQPDAIAVGATPALAIAILNAGGKSAETKVRQIQSLFKGRDDWRLEVVYVTPNGVPLQAVTAQEIQVALRQVRSLAKDEPRAGLLMAWATLEAIGRTLEPELAARSLSPGSLIDLLISTGHLPQSEGAKLRELGETRNALAHGQINRSPSPMDVNYLVDLGENLVLN